MRKSRARSGCREYRVIKFTDLPKVTEGIDGAEREATDADLLQFGIHVFDRGANKVQAICNGYWDEDLQTGVNAAGDPWPGTRLAGRKGMYRVKRQAFIEASLNGYKGGENSGRKRLMLDKRPEESERTYLEKGKTIKIPAVTLTESDRLARALPKIMGDG